MNKRRDPMERLRRMKLRRAGHPAPPTRREPGGEYLEFDVEGGALLEYGYPERIVFLVRTDVECEPGDLVLVEREPTVIDGRALRLEGDDGLRIGILGKNRDGSPRLESLTCGAYTYDLKRVIGKVLGPVAEADGVDESELEWPEYIDDGRAA